MVYVRRDKSREPTIQWNVLTELYVCKYYFRKINKQQGAARMEEEVAL